LSAIKKPRVPKKTQGNISGIPYQKETSDLTVFGTTFRHM